ncbi:hypothetical protein [Croceitalea dokdonensis]|uniref:hypothetical protein n=1 Tax=Croceitalea dokdonensis TaxID=346188 RepID=UPI0006CA0C45|nr:hypothetical protein [Croceitalea dokdonensis]
MVQDILQNVKNWGKHHATIRYVIQTDLQRQQQDSQYLDYHFLLGTTHPRQLTINTHWLSKFGTLINENSKDFGAFQVVKAKYQDGCYLKFVLVDCTQAPHHSCVISKEDPNRLLLVHK